MSEDLQEISFDLHLSEETSDISQLNLLMLGNTNRKVDLFVEANKNVSFS